MTTPWNTPLQSSLAPSENGGVKIDHSAAA